MANLSLARIMYGTNEDFHASHGMSAPAFSSLTARPDRENSTKGTARSEPATLGELLHKVWTTLTRKY